MRFFIYILFSSFIPLLGLHGQNLLTANYISNGGFEDSFNCNPSNVSNAKCWNDLDSILPVVPYCNFCIGNVPYNGFGFQYPRSGKAYCIADFFAFNVQSTPRTYLRNRMKSTLAAGKTYCVKFFVNVGNHSSCAMDGFGAYFGNITLDTIIKAHLPLTYLTPQIQNLSFNIISDTLNWIAITGTFVANGTEKYMVIGNFKNDASTNFSMLYVTSGPTVSTISVDDVSCIPLDLSAYAGSDKSCKIGDSVYIGRQRDVGIDEDCMWFKLPINITPTTAAIDTAAGIYVKPTQASTYVVKQDICGVVKYDTVVVFSDLVGLDDSKFLNESLNIFPNPVENRLSFSNGKITNSKFKIIITNLLGQVLFAKDNFKLEEELEVSFLPNGIYYLKVENEMGQKVFKVLKE